MSWEKAAFLKVVTDITGGNRKFQSSEYRSAGRNPILDQGAQFIGGYTDEDAVVSRKKDVLIFGDHTKVLKYVDFDFCLGADGVKVLETADCLNTKFLYYFLKTVQIPNAGYSRHFKFLKPLQIPLPPLPVQQKIADILDAADALGRKDQELLAKYDELAQAIFIDMFGDPVRNEKGWEVKRIIDVTSKERPITYGILKPGANIKPVGVPYVRVVDIKNQRILVNNLCYTSSKIAGEYKRSTLREGDILFTIRGHVGRSCMVPVTLNGANITQDTARLDFEGVTNHYALGYLNTSYFERVFKPLVRGAAVKGLNLGDLRELPILVPPIKYQEKYGAVIKNLSTQKMSVEIKAKSSGDLFNSLTQKAFKGELVA